MDPLTAAREQMEISLGFHMIFAAAGMALPLMMLIAEAAWLRTGDLALLDLARTWGKVTAVLFAIGAVSGTALGPGCAPTGPVAAAAGHPCRVPGDGRCGLAHGGGRYRVLVGLVARAGAARPGVSGAGCCRCWCCPRLRDSWRSKPAGS